MKKREKSIVSKPRLNSLRNKLRRNVIKMRIERLRKKEKTLGKVKNFDSKVERLMEELKKSGFNEAENY